jgi:hypothetical protein
MFSNKKSNIHTIFSSECISFFDWQSLALFHSFNTSGQSGKITRLLACSEYDSYNDVLKDFGNTFVHRNMRDDPLVHEKNYPSYNKPYSIMAFLEKEDVSAEYIIMLDSDMIIRKPINPKSLGAKPGTVVSAEYSYLVGADNAFKKRFLDTDNSIYKVGGFHIFHIDDLRKIVPLWFEYTKKVRTFMHENVDTYLRESMLSPETAGDVQKKQAKWHAEMYGYIFAASQLNISHVVTKDVMLYPGYEPYLQRQPYILHYGIDYTVKNVLFNKMTHTNLYISKCNGFLFNNADLDINTSKKDSISIENIDQLNSALCYFYEEKCTQKCLPEHKEKIKEDLEYISNTWKCDDQNINCELWASQGECLENVLYMNNVCTKSCNLCIEEHHNIDYKLVSLITIFIGVLLILGRRYYIIKKTEDKDHIV